MKTRSKTLLLALCAVLLVVGSVMGTMAYLTSQDAVTNTFTVGSVAITLDETDVNTAGVKDGETRVDANTYKLMPGHSYTKDPIVHVDEDSEDSWLFVKVENEIAAIEDSTTIADQMTAKGWTPVADTTNIYAYKEVVNAGDDITVFETFKIKGDVINLSSYEGKTVKVTAYAVQADGFETAAAAWNATFGAN